MANFNKVILLGNLTRDVELRNVAGGQSVGEFGLAVNRQFTTKDGQKREEVTFVNCEAWGRQAEVLKQYMSKGRPLFIEGRLKYDSWEDKQTGKKQSKLVVVVENFQFIGGRGEGAPARSEASEQHQTADQGSYADADAPAHNPVPSTDIPF